MKQAVYTALFYVVFCKPFPRDGVTHVTHGNLCITCVYRTLQLFTNTVVVVYSPSRVFLAAVLVAHLYVPDVHPPPPCPVDLLKHSFSEHILWPSVYQQGQARKGICFNSGRHVHVWGGEGRGCVGEKGKDVRMYVFYTFVALDASAPLCVIWQRGSVYVNMSVTWYAF